MKRNFEDRKVLVTGGAGFIGSHLVGQLVNKHAQVKVVDNLSRGTLKNIRYCLDEIEFVKGDLMDKKIAEKAAENVDFCFHLAAVVAGVEYMSSHPAEFFRNLVVDRNVLEACRKANVENFLYTSSACVYPVELQRDVNQRPLREEDAIGSGQPDGNYGWVKLLGEIQCRSYHKAYGMKMVIVRPFNPYGPHESFDPKDCHVIPSLIRKAVNGQKPFVVWGDGKQVRSFEYVKDVVEGMILAIQKVTDAQPINLGGANPVTVQKLANLILTITKRDASIVWDTDKPQGVRSRKGSIKKAKEVLGWCPKVSFEKGLEKTIQWYIKKV